MVTRIKSLLKKFLKNVLKIKVERIPPAKPEKKDPPLKMKFVHDPASSYMVEEKYQTMLQEELAGIAEAFFNQEFFPVREDFRTTEAVQQFFELYSNRPHRDNTHGSGFHNAFWMYLTASALHPALIVESGVWKAHTTWLLEQSCPGAEIYGFDRNLRHVQYQDLQATLLEHDWNEYEFGPVDRESSLVFFDCHVNHAQRILEASQKGFKHLIFDDNPPVHKIFSHVPGIPTAAMLYTGEGLDQPELSWIWNDKEYQKTIDLDQARAARDLIKVHQYFPDVGGPTRYGGFAFLTYVQI